MSQEVQSDLDDQDALHDSEMEDFKASLGPKGEVMTKDILEAAFLIDWAAKAAAERRKVSDSIR